MPADALRGFTIYAPTTTDFPGRYVVRGWRVSSAGAVLDAEPTAVTTTLEEARAAIPPGLVCFDERVPGNDPVLLESWI